MIYAGKLDKAIDFNITEEVIMSVRIGLVGCGRIAKRHADLLGNGNIKNAELAAVCDIKEDRAKEYNETYKVPCYFDMHKMMENEDIDLIAVLTPSGMHARNVLDLVKYKKHILVEKPMALTLDDSDSMIRACDENNIKLFVVKQNRFNVPVRKLRQALEDGRFGKLVLGTVRVRWCRTQDYYDQDSWRGTWAQDGGVFANQASHHIDLLEWIMGDVDSVFAKSSTALVDIETEDTGVAILKFRNGAIGIVEATTAARPVNLEGSISILGETGTVEIGGFAVNEMKTWKFADKQDDENEIFEKYSVNPPDVYGFGHKEYYDNVIDSIVNNKRSLVDGLQGRRSLELINAFYESIETGKEVNLRFKPKKCRLGIQ